MKSRQINFNVHSIIECTESEGPHKRLAIWFQGCRFNCKGCSNVEMHSYSTNQMYRLEELIEIIKNSKMNFNIEGVTLLGGEPLDQINLIDLLKEIKLIKLGVILFTGYLYNQISKEVIDNTDMIVDGLYKEELRINTNSIVGSTNQKINLITKRYKESDLIIQNSEINIVNNSIVINGKI